MASARANVSSGLGPLLHAWSLASRNVFRHRGRTILTLVVIASGVVGLILTGGFVQDSLIKLREATIHSQLGHLQIFRKGFFVEGTQRPYKYLIEKPQPLLDQIRSMPQVDDAMPRLGFAGVVNNGRTDFAVFGEGVEPDREARLGTSLTIVAGRTLADGDRYGALIGEGVATATRLAPGDRMTILLNTAEGALNNIEFDIVGVFRSISKDYDAHAVRIPIASANELVATDGANAIVVSLKKTDDTDAVAALLAESLAAEGIEIKTWRELADFYDKTAALYERQFVVLQAIILIAVFLSVVNSVNMTTFERTGEFGTLMALGSRGSSLFRMVLLENVILGAMGGLCGVVFGVAIAALVSAIGIPMPPPPNSSAGYTAAIHLTPIDVMVAGAVGFIATVIASIAPAIRISRVPVVEALRQN